METAKTYLSLHGWNTEGWGPQSVTGRGRGGIMYGWEREREYNIWLGGERGLQCMVRTRRGRGIQSVGLEGERDGDY